MSELKHSVGLHIDLMQRRGIGDSQVCINKLLSLGVGKIYLCALGDSLKGPVFSALFFCHWFIDMNCQVASSRVNIRDCGRLNRKSPNAPPAAVWPSVWPAASMWC